MKITESRRSDVKAVLERHLLSGGTAAMFTLTIPHTRFQRVTDTRRAVADGWKAVQQGAGWKALKRNFRWAGAIRAMEVTHGDNGWHPHLHVVILFYKGLTSEKLDEFSGQLFDRWSRSIARAGFGECSEKGFSMEPITDAAGVSKYCQKWGAAEELTKAHIKAARNGGRSPWQILSDIEERGEARDKALFGEYASAFKGARQLTWSRGLREKYLDEPERKDEELAAEPGCEDVEASRELSIEASVWRQVVRRRAQGDLLSSMDRGGVGAALELIASYGIRFQIAERRGLHGNLVPVLLQPD